jgi:hypothetical protein
MRIVFAILHIALIAIVATGAIELAAVIMRARVAWLHAAIFGVVIALISMGVQAISASTGLLVGFAAGFALELALGGWFFGSRAYRRNGDALGAGGGAIVTGIAQLILVAIGFLLVAIVHFTH